MERSVIAFKSRHLYLTSQPNSTPGLRIAGRPSPLAPQRTAGTSFLSSRAASRDSDNPRTNAENVPYDLVIFDLDGVLVDSERIVTRIEEEYFATIGVQMSAEHALALFKGKTNEELAQRIESRAPRRLPTAWTYDWAMATANALVRELGPSEGVASVLQWLTDAGKTLAVASQSPMGRIELSLFVTHLASYFGDRLYSASMVEKPKPAPDLYLYVARELGVPLERCCVVEDSPTGVRAAVAAGMAVFGYAADEDPKALASAGATVFTKMTELRGLLPD